MVTLAYRPLGLNRIGWKDLFDQNAYWILPPGSKSQYKCVAYLIDMPAHPTTIVSNTCYWFGLFTHQRDTYIWKGMLQLELSEVLDSIMHILAHRDHPFWLFGITDSGFIGISYSGFIGITFWMSPE